MDAPGADLRGPCGRHVILVLSACLLLDKFPLTVPIDDVVDFLRFRGRGIRSLDPVNAGVGCLVSLISRHSGSRSVGEIVGGKFETLLVGCSGRCWGDPLFSAKPLIVAPTLSPTWRHYPQLLKKMSREEIADVSYWNTE